MVGLAWSGQVSPVFVWGLLLVGLALVGPSASQQPRRFVPHVPSATTTGGGHKRYLQDVHHVDEHGSTQTIRYDAIVHGHVFRWVHGCLTATLTLVPSETRFHFCVIVTSPLHEDVCVSPPPSPRTHTLPLPRPSPTPNEPISRAASTMTTTLWRWSASRTGW